MTIHDAFEQLAAALLPLQIEFTWPAAWLLSRLGRLPITRAEHEADMLELYGWQRDASGQYVRKEAADASRD